MQESWNEARGNLDRKDFYEFGYRPRKTFGGKKKKTTSVRMNEIPAAHQEFPSSSSIQSYYKWICTQRAVANT